MNENKSLAGQPAIIETPAEQLNAGTGLGKVMDTDTSFTSLSIDVKATVEELAKDNDALAKAFADVNGIGKEESITDEESQALVIKNVMDTAYQQILKERGPGAWEAEFHHASAVAQTF